MRKALVTGANGFLGSALATRLLDDGVSVRAMCRSGHKGAHLADAGAEVTAGDVQDAERLAHLARGCDVVFHVAAASVGAARTYNVNVLGTRNAIRAAAEAGAARFVHVSTVAVYGFGVEGRVDESHPQTPSAHDFYQQSKSLGEAAMWAEARRLGIPASSVRPAFIYGPGSNFWSRRLYDLAAHFAAPLIDDGSSHAHPVYVDDVVDLLVTCATHPDAPGSAFHAAPDPAPTWAEYLGHYMRMAGRDAVVRVPIETLSALGPAAALVSRLRGNPFDLAGFLRFMGHRATFSMARAAEQLGWRPRYTLDEGMALTEPWLREVSTGRRMGV
ncbi:MAG: NAD-dependent epimerase/dehydratase family protein [Anaerolineae bacterium]|nr:NAD-dependent epimerase/dehydratase family protein [Anaerolineae bacterium]